jgi:hypothetical protein
VKTDDTTASLFIHCLKEKTCGPINIVDLCNGEDAICKRKDLLKSMISDTKEHELFHIGYMILKGKGQRAWIVTLADTMLRIFVSEVSMKEALINLADVVVYQKPVTWDVLSDISRFLASMRIKGLPSHRLLIEKMNKKVQYLGIGLDV